MTPAPGVAALRRCPAPGQRWAGQPGAIRGTSRSSGCQPRAGLVAAHHRGGDPGEHGVVRELAPHHGAGPDDGVPPEASCPAARPRPAPSQDPAPISTGSSAGHCCADRRVGIGVDVVLVGDVAARAGDHVVAEDDRTVGDEVGAAADEAAVADAQHRGGGPGRQGLTGGHADGQA